MEEILSQKSFLFFNPAQERDYGWIRLFDGQVDPRLPFRYSKFSVLPGRSTKQDKHEVPETWVVLSGNGQLSLDADVKVQITSGDVIHFNSLQLHQVFNDASEPLLIFSFWWKHDESTI